MTSTTKIVLSMMAAAAAGAAIGVLLAPEKGSETRKKLRNNFNEWLDELNALLARATGPEESPSKAEAEF